MRRRVRGGSEPFFSVDIDIGDIEHGAKRRRLTQAERTALSDSRMFNAAMMLISEQGSTRTTLKAICEKAGYSRGLATHRFGSKEAFLRGLLLHFNRAWETHLERHVEGKRGLEALFSAIDALEGFLQEHPRYMRGSYTIWYESIGGQNEVRKKLQENHHAYRCDLQRYVTEGIEDGTIDAATNADAFAVFYCSVVFGTIFQWLVKPEVLDLPRFFDYFRDIARRLLRKD